MSEEEKAIEWCKAQKSRYIQILLDLYNKEKEKNKDLKKYKEYYENEKVIFEPNKFVRKDKIKEIINKYGYEDVAIQKILELLGE